MSFEAEVIPLFIGGVTFVSALELAFGCFMLKQHRGIRRRLIGHAVSTVVAMFFLVRCIFANWLDIELGIASISNSVNIALFGMFWAVSVFFLLSMVAAVAEKDNII